MTGRVQRRIKAQAIKRHRRRVNLLKVNRGHCPLWRPCTPEWELPEALRVGA